MPPQQPRMQPTAHMAHNYMPNVAIDPTQALAYGNYVQQRPAAYAMQQGGLPQHTGHQS